MICPVCGKEMKIGEVANARGERFFWAPKDFFCKHVFNPSSHLKKTIENEGGIIIKIRNRVISAPTIGYACKECKMILIDCN